MRSLLLITLLSVLFVQPLEAKTHWGTPGMMVKWGAFFAGIISVPLTAIHIVEVTKLTDMTSSAGSVSSEVNLSRNLEIASSVAQGLTAISGLGLYVYAKYAQIAERDVSRQLRVMLPAAFLVSASALGMSAYSASNLAQVGIASSQYVIAILEASFAGVTTISLGVGTLGAFGL